MELPADVLIHNAILNLKGAQASLLHISPHGFYEANVRFGDRTHRVLLPISETVVIAQVPEEAGGPPMEVER